MSRAQAARRLDLSDRRTEYRPIEWRGSIYMVNKWIKKSTFKQRMRKGNMTVEQACNERPAVCGAKGSPLFNGEVGDA